jgi:hypothetical protein
MKTLVKETKMTINDCAEIIRADVRQDQATQLERLLLDLDQWFDSDNNLRLAGAYDIWRRVLAMLPSDRRQAIIREDVTRELAS